MTREGTSVLLYSGGMDSYIAAHLWQPDLLLYVAIGHRYEGRELHSIEKSGINVTVDQRLHLGDLEMSNAIIPLRNLYLIAVASHHGTTIGLGALQGEVNADKSEQFRQQTQDVLNTCYAESYWSTGIPITVTYPVANYTKAQLLQKYATQGGDVDRALANTRSCYEAGDLPCGHCAACIKRYIATTLVGASEELHNDPHTSPYLSTMRQRWDTFDDTRRQETAAVFPELREGE